MHWTNSAESAGLRPGRVRSRSPSRPDWAKRFRHRMTVLRLTPSSRAMAWFANPCAQRKTMCARKTIFCVVLRPRTRRRRAFRCGAVRARASADGHINHPIAKRVLLYSYLCGTTLAFQAQFLARAHPRDERNGAANASERSGKSSLLVPDLSLAFQAQFLARAHPRDERNGAANARVCEKTLGQSTAAQDATDSK